MKRGFFGRKRPSIVIAGKRGDSMEQKTSKEVEAIRMIMQSDSPDIVTSDIFACEKEFHTFMNKVIKRRHMTRGKLLDSIGVERSCGYQILNGRRVATRNIVLRMAVYLGLSVRETQMALALAQKQALYPHNTFETVMIYALSHDYTLEQTEEFLQQLGAGSLLGD